jgi:PAS domain S-box-containing protein
MERLGMHRLHVALRSVIAWLARRIGRQQERHMRSTSCQSATPAALSRPHATARRQVEEELHQAATRYRSVVEGSCEGILILQEDVIRYVNQACAQIFGYAQAEELIGQQFYETLIDAEAWPELQAGMAGVLRGERLVTRHGWPGMRKGGMRIWLQVTGHVITWQQRPALVCFFTDITAHKQTEEALVARVQQEDDPTFMLTLVEEFLQDATAYVAALYGAAEADDAASLERAAHTLKSTSASLGTLGMAALCQQLQELGHTGTVAGAAELLQQLTDEFMRVRQALVHACAQLQDALPSRQP